MNAATPPDEGNSGFREDRRREVNYRYSRELVDLLERMSASLVVSTYQAGKLLVVGTHAGALTVAVHNFEQAMGIAVGPSQLAVGTRRQVWFLQRTPELAGRLEPAGTYDACYLTRRSMVTGEMDGHEMAWSSDGTLWIVNTLFSCLCTLDGVHSFVPRWTPPFVTRLAPEDRCHLNGLAFADGRPKYVTALGESDAAQGWRPGKAAGGVLLDVESGAVVARGLAMPHSPRVHAGRVWLLDSGRGRLVTCDVSSGRVDPVTAMPGYTRGLALSGPFAFVGLSKIRETSTFGGIPIAENRAELKCGVGAVDLQTGRTVAHLEFTSGVDEIFDVQIVPNARSIAIAGPYAEAEGKRPIWMIPAPG